MKCSLGPGDSWVRMRLRAFEGLGKCITDQEKLNYLAKNHPPVDRKKLSDTWTRSEAIEGLKMHSLLRFSQLSFYEPLIG